MIKGDRKRKPPPVLAMPLSEAIARLLRTDPEEVTVAHERVRARQEHVRRNVDEARAEIRRGAKPPGKPFRL